VPTSPILVNCHHGHRVADYQLLVYGSKTHDAKYCKMCEELIVELNLQDNVKIKGLGKPTKILPTGWVYLPHVWTVTCFCCIRTCLLLFMPRSHFTYYLPVWPVSMSRHVNPLLLLLAELCDGRAACVYIGGWSVRLVRGMH